MPYHVGKSGSCPTSKPHAVIKNDDGKVMGCHATKEDAERQIAAIHANEGASVTQTDVELAVVSPKVTGDTGYSVELMNGTKWEGVLVVEGVETGDGRKFAENAITWADLPLPLRRNIEDSHGGMPMTKAVLVGRIDEIYRNPENPLEIRGRGVFDDEGEHGAEALRLVRGGFLKGVSVDPDDIKDADVELVFPQGDGDESDEDDMLMELFAMPELTVFHAGRLRAATLVDIPAFVEAQIWLADEGDEPTSTAPEVLASAHFANISDRPWSGAAHERRLAGQMSLRTARTAYAHVDNGVGSPGKIAARFLHHEIGDDGDVGAANIAACANGIRAINAGRAMSLSTSERRAAYEHLATHLRAAGLSPQPYEDPGDVVIASGVEPDRPPAGWFADPGFETLTPLTITEEKTSGGWRRIFGHGAGWRTCHTSFGDTCTTAPREPHGEHSYFRLGEVVCDDGSRVAVGHITLGTGHAPIRGVSASQAAEHYDNTGTVVALVASGEDAHGIWIAGAIKPGVPEERIVELQHSSLSGDWRRIGGQLRLVAFLAVNRPGFPIPRTSLFVKKDEQLSLVAAGVVTQDMRRVQRDMTTHIALERIARGIGRDTRSRMAELRARVKGM